MDANEAKYRFSEGKLFKLFQAGNQPANYVYVFSSIYAPTKRLAIQMYEQRLLTQASEQ